MNIWYGAHVPDESELRLCGEVRGTRVVEVGIAPVPNSIAFAKAGAILPRTAAQQRRAAGRGALGQQISRGAAIDGERAGQQVESAVRADPVVRYVHAGEEMQRGEERGLWALVHSRHTREPIFTLLHHQRGSQWANRSPSISHKKIGFFIRERTATTSYFTSCAMIFNLNSQLPQGISHHLRIIRIQ